MPIVGGIPTDDQGYVHTTFTHNPSTLRLASERPNLQNLPRTNTGELQALVRGMFEAPPGYTFWARDFSGIEAVLVGYFAWDTTYMRLAKLGVHDYFNAFVLRETRKILPSDVPDLSATDAELKAQFKALKARFPVERDIAKRVVHLSNYRGTPSRMHKEYPETFRTVKDASRLQGMYFSAFSTIPSWHGRICQAVHDGSDPYQPPAGACGPGWFRNPFGGVHRFWNVLEHKFRNGHAVWDYGEDAKKLIACGPQSTAAAIMKYALLLMWAYPGKDWARDTPASWVGETLRLSVHDELLGLVTQELLEAVLAISQEVMERPWEALPVTFGSWPTSCLSIGTEAKSGRIWGEMA